MSPGFWNNTIWFLLLGITTIIELTFIIIKAENRKLIIALLFSVSGMLFIYEWFILLSLKAYNYYPMLIPHSVSDENIAGNLFSQFSVTATALLIAILNLKYYWYFIVAFIYGLIEELFIKLGVFTHNWYRTWMTVTGFILLFWVTKKIYKYCLKQNVEGFFRYILVFLGLFAPYMISMWALKLIGIFNVNQNILPDVTIGEILVISLNFIFLSLIMMIVYYLKIKLKWKFLVILALYFAFYFVKKLNLEYFAAGWLTFAIITIKIFSMYLYIFILDKLYNHSGTKLSIK